MRGWRALLTVAGLGVAVAPAAAQTLPDDGPTDQVELVSGEVIRGTLERLYHPKNAQAGAEWAGLVINRAEDGTKLWVPRGYFSAAQWYWSNRRLWFPGPADPVYRGKDGDGNPAPDPEPNAYVLFDLARWALWAGPKTWAQSKGHFEHSVKLAETDGDEKTDPKAWQDAYVKNLKDEGVHISTKDARWVDEDVFYSEQGWKKWRGKWVPPEEHARLVNEESAGAKRSLEGLVDKPDEYQRVHLGLVRAFPGAYQPDKKGEWPRVRFFARYAAAPEDKFTPISSSAKWKAPEYLRLRVIHDDCAHVYLAVKNQRLVERAKKLQPGEAVELFGRLIVVQGLVLLECEGIALR